MTVAQINERAYRLNNPTSEMINKWAGGGVYNDKGDFEFGAGTRENEWYQNRNPVTVAQAQNEGQVPGALAVNAWASNPPSASGNVPTMVQDITGTNPSSLQAQIAPDQAPQTAVSNWQTATWAQQFGGGASDQMATNPASAGIAGPSSAPALSQDFWGNF
jgi:hypothetical protein